MVEGKRSGEIYYYRVYGLSVYLFRLVHSDFCTVNNVSATAFRKWLKQYEAEGLEGLARTDAEIREVLPDGIDRTEEAYKREIIRLRVENERLKKNYMARRRADGRMEYCRLKPKNLK